MAVAVRLLVAVVLPTHCSGVCCWAAEEVQAVVEAAGVAAVAAAAVASVVLAAVVLAVAEAAAAGNLYLLSYGNTKMEKAFLKIPGARKMGYFKGRHL